MKNTIISIILSFIPICIFSQSIKDTVNLNQVEIKDKNVSFIKNEIKNEELKNIAIRDMGDYLRSVPNVSGVRKGGTSIDPIVRGFRANQINTQIDDGIKIEGGCPNRMDPTTSRIEAEEIEKIEIIKGPFALKYGPAMGGVVNLISEKPRPFDKNQIHVKLFTGYESNWNGYREQLSLYGGGKKIFYHITGGFRNYGNYKDGNGDTVNSSFSKYNYSAKVGIAPKSNQNIILTYKEIHSMEMMYPALPMDELEDNTRIMAIDYNIKDVSDKINSAEFKIYNSNVTHIMDNSERRNFNSIVSPYSSIMRMYADVNAINTGGRGELNFKAGKNNMALGVNYENIRKDGERTMRMINSMMDNQTIMNLWNNAVIQNYGIYSEYKSTYFVMAVRCDYNMANSDDTLNIIKSGNVYFGDTKSGYFNFSMNLCVNKEITENLIAGIAIGRGTRSPNMLERYIKFLTVGYDNYDYLGNPQLKPETNNEADFTLKYKSNKVGSAYFNIFCSYIQNYITGTILAPSVAPIQTMTAIGVKQFTNADFAVFKGFEFGYNSPDSCKFGVELTAYRTIAAMKEVVRYNYSGTQVISKTTLEKDALPEIPPLESTINISYKLFKNKLIPKAGMRVIAEQDYVSKAYYERRTPCFVLANFVLIYKCNKNINLSAGVNNIFNMAYYEHLNRRIVGSTYRLFEPGRVVFANLLINI
ncbi:MAG: TonB-dependent receptor [Bacteroidales bacterium]|nr:TonB-dependent receptor [Bacteroidales bacterium]